MVRHRGTGTVGAILKFQATHVTVKDQAGREHLLPNSAGAFSVKGRSVQLVAPKPKPKGKTLTASGSIAIQNQKAQVAKASRILVEGHHDAELVEKVWGDDLRAEAVVVEPLHGADDLAAVVAEFAPSPERRLGILLDHFVKGTKEWHIANSVTDANVLITGHPYVDVWQAVKPGLVGIQRWPDIPRNEEWKAGICARLGFTGTSGEFWRRLLGRVRDYRDLEPGMVGAVEQLIDFVAPPPQD